MDAVKGKNTSNSKADDHLQETNEADNPGLDADGSSLDSPAARYSDDNDRISGNPDGENDIKDTNEREISSPLDDK